MFSKFIDNMYAALYSLTVIRYDFNHSTIYSNISKLKTRLKVIVRIAKINLNK